MIDSRLIKRISQEVGSGPALAWYLERMKLQETIDRCVSAHHHRTELSHGQAVVGLVTMLLNHSHALYHMEEWAKDSHILSQVLPGIPAAAYTDDRLGDTLDALFAAGLDDVQSQVSLAICQAFQLPVQTIHCDTTTLSFFGAYVEGEALAGPNASGAPIVPRITYGHSKQHRPDLKQLLLSLSVNEDQLPLMGTVLDGNTADANTYLKQWLAIGQMLGRSDFLFLGDSKLASRKNLRAIIAGEGVFLSAATLTPKLKKELQKQPSKKGSLTWRPFPIIPGQVAADDVKGYTYAQRIIKIGSGRPYRIRQLIIRAEALAQRHAATRQRHLAAFQQRLQTLNGKLNQYQLKTQEQIQKALDKLSRRYPQAAALVSVRLTYTTEVRKRLCGPGRAGKNRKYRTTTHRRYRLECQTDKAAMARAQRLDGIFIRVTNATEARLPDSLALVTYKDQWKVERQNRLLKGPIALTPVFLHKPERIAALAIVCLMAIQVLRLMEREAQKSLAEQGEALVGLYPNKIKTDHPPALRLIEALSSIHVMTIEHKNKPSESESYLTTLTPLQRKIIAILKVPTDYYSPRRVLQKIHKTQKSTVET